MQCTCHPNAETRSEHTDLNNKIIETGTAVAMHLSMTWRSLVWYRR